MARDLLRESLATIEKLKARLAERGADNEPIAIVGVGCRYPGADSIDELWSLLTEQRESVAEVPADRWDIDVYYDPDPKAAGRMTTRRAGFLRNVDQFDPHYFGISPREAAALDPQQRLLLETTVEALDAAAIPADRLATTLTGVFVGVSTNDYGRLMWADGVDKADPYSATGGALNAVSGRIAFTFGLQGPCMTVDTACSSSLVAVHLACQSLRNRESNLAIAGGVNVILLPDAMVMFSRWGMMSADGRCKTFDAAADGFARAEGCGVVVLKRLSDALAAGDPIRAVIRGSAVNSDGRSSGMTVPHGPAQESVVRQALASARLSPSDIDYVEAHGTGTPIGDPIEVGALAGVFGPSRPVDRPLLIGALKPNIGHAEAAAGMAGLLKLVASLEHEQLPGQAHFHTPNPRIEWAAGRVKVVDQNTSWPRTSRPRLAGLSGFGLSGTNAHVILEEAPVVTPGAVVAERPVTVPLSAMNDAALKTSAASHAAALSQPDGPSLADAAITLSVGRSQLRRRAAITAETREELVSALQELSAGKRDDMIGSARPGEPAKIAFLFTGQGAQYPGMGRALYDNEPVFRARMDRAAEALRPVLQRDLLDVIYGDSGDRLSQTAYTQPALFALEVALADVWTSWGVTPAAVLGHSVGEYAAACVAGVVGFEDGLALIAERGRLMQALPAGGTMAAIFATRDVVAKHIASAADRVAIAGYNGPEETVISGDGEAVARFVAGFEAEGVSCRRLEVSHAFHSPLLDPMLDAFQARAAGVAFAAPRMPLISNLTGAAFAFGAAPDARYWRRHAREPVAFAQSLEALRALDIGALLEIGPHPTLLGLAARALPGAAWRQIPSLRRNRDDRRHMKEALGGLFVAGASIDWRAAQAQTGGQRVNLPSYPFQRDRYWVDTQKKRVLGSDLNAHPLLGARMLAPPPNASFASEIDAAKPAYLADHVVLGKTLYPGAAFLEMALAAARAVSPEGPVRLRNVAISAALDITDGESRVLHTSIEREEGRRVVRIRRVGDVSWIDHATATIDDVREEPVAPVRVAPLRGAAMNTVDVEGYYDRLEEFGLRYGPNFRGVSQLSASPNAAYGLVELPDAGMARGYGLHPALLDAAFHVLGGVFLAEAEGERSVFLPMGMREVVMLAPAGPRVWVAVSVRETGEDQDARIADVTLEDESGAVVAYIRGLELRKVTEEALARALQDDHMRTHAMRRVWEPAQIAQGAAPAACILLPDRGGLASELASVLTAQGVQASVVSDDALAAALEAAPREGAVWVVDCAAVGRAWQDDASRDGAAMYSRALRLARTLAGVSPRIGYCLLTCGAHIAGPGDGGDPAAHELVGFWRTVAVERPFAPVVRIDLDPAAQSSAAHIVALITTPLDGAREFAVRQGETRTQRLENLRPVKSAAANPMRVARIRERGDLDRIVIEEMPRRAPAAGEIEIAVRAAGLNFRDVLNALGMYPGDAGRLGSEVSGVVTAVGEGVSIFKAGDEVVSLAGDSIATHAIARAVLSTHKPHGLTYAQAVTLPNTYLTAALCLRVGRFKPGARVLVHAAAGGVGLAAMRLARRAGATIFATAGAPEKQALVKAEGASLVFSSRHADFADAILAATGGEGVDLVINSLTGAFIRESFRALRSGGSFIEIGKAETMTAEQAATLRADVHYAVRDLGEEIVRDADAVGRELAEIVADSAAGELPPLPVRVFPLEDTKEAFRYMAGARHIGKIAIAPPAGPVAIRRDAAYLVTGGLGGLGLAAAEHLARRGAGEIILAARRDPTAIEDQQLAKLRGLGAEVRRMRCNVSDPAAVASLAKTLAGNGRPLRGIVHSAGVLADAALEAQDEASYRTVAAPKSEAAWALHNALGGLNLDFFVFFSSTSALIGSPGQANYAASNAFMDGLAGWLRARGFAATSIGWGAWGEVGMAAALAPETRATWARLGLGLLDRDSAFAGMDAALEGGLDYAAIAALDMERLRANGGPGLRSLFGLETQSGVGEALAEANVEASRILAASDEDRGDAVTAFTRANIARVLGFSAASLDADTPLSELGFDSLMAVQIRNAVQSALNVDIPVKRLLQGPTVAEVSADIVAQLGVSAAPKAAAEPEWEKGTL